MALRFSAVLLLTVVLAAPARAQNPSTAQENQGVVVVSLFQCAFEHLDSLATMFRTRSAPVYEDLVREGRLINFGALRHAWGDEWNWVTYFTARDLPTFLAARQEALRRLRERFPNPAPNFCTLHKDNIYDLMYAAPAMPPPGGR